MRRVAALLVGGAIVAATAAGLWTVARRVALPPNGLIERDEIVPWDGALLDGDRLTLYFTGAPPLNEGDACSRAYDAAAQPANDTVVVTIHAFAGSRLLPAQGCEDIGYERSVTLELEEPLQGRTVVDGGSGQRPRVSDATEVLTPSWMPDGYRRARQYVDSDVDVQEWVRDGGPEVRLTIERGRVDEVGQPGYKPVVLDEPTVRGVPATVWMSKGFDDLVCTSWAEGGVGHRVCSSGTAGQLLAYDVLVRVADHLVYGHDLPREDRGSDLGTAATES